MADNKIFNLKLLYMKNLEITLEEQKIIIDLIYNVRKTINPDYDFFKKQREELTIKLNNNIMK